jgi:hypothetical protein
MEVEIHRSQAVRLRCNANFFAALHRDFRFVAVSAFYDDGDIPKT